MKKDSVQRIGIDARWRYFTNAEEEQRLSVLDGRIERRAQLSKWDLEERTRIMNRAIRRMRRSKGLT